MARVRGVTGTVPVVVIPQTADVHGALQQVNLVGAPVGSAAARQPLVAGTELTGRGQAVVDKRMGVGVGSRVSVGGHPFTVVGVTSDRTLLGGAPDMYVDLRDAQTTAFEGSRLINAVVVAGTPATLPGGLAIMTNAQIERSSLQQMANAVSSINNSKILMWAIAAVIVASLVYVTALERTRGLRRAEGTRRLFGVVVRRARLPGGVGRPHRRGTRRRAVPVHDRCLLAAGRRPAARYIALPVSAVVVGMLSSLIALRRAVGADPAAAFAG